MYSTHNEGKSVIIERFTRTLKNKIYKYMVSDIKKMFKLINKMILLITTHMAQLK